MTDDQASAQTQNQPTVTVALELPSAQLLADQIATIHDLQFVIECCKRLLSELMKPEEEREAVVPQALWSAALTSYDRAFAKGKKFGLTVDDVKALPLEGQVVKFHEWIVDKRTRSGTPPTRSTWPGSARCCPIAPRPTPRCGGSPCCQPATSWSTERACASWGRSRPNWPSRPREGQKQESTVAADAQKLGLDKLYAMAPLPVGAPSDKDDEDLGSESGSVRGQRRVVAG